MNNQRIRCKCTTQKGERCKNNALANSLYCKLHKNCAKPFTTIISKTGAHKSPVKQSSIGDMIFGPRRPEKVRKTYNILGSNVPVIMYKNMTWQKILDQLNNNPTTLELEEPRTSPKGEVRSDALHSEKGDLYFEGRPLSVNGVIIKKQSRIPKKRFSTIVGSLQYSSNKIYSVNGIDQIDTSYQSHPLDSVLSVKISPELKRSGEKSPVITKTKVLPVIPNVQPLFNRISQPYSTNEVQTTIFQRQSSPLSRSKSKSPLKLTQGLPNSLSKTTMTLIPSTKTFISPTEIASFTTIPSRASSKPVKTNFNTLEMNIRDDRNDWRKYYHSGGLFSNSTANQIGYVLANGGVTVIYKEGVFRAPLDVTIEGKRKNVGAVLEKLYPILSPGREPINVDCNNDMSVCRIID